VDGKSMWNRTAASGVFNGMRFRARPMLVWPQRLCQKASMLDRTRNLAESTIKRRRV
jgi:hypothetical protein